jgi:hypothetical protein
MSEKFEQVDWKVRHKRPGKRAMNTHVGEIELDGDGVVVRVRGASVVVKRDGEGRPVGFDHGPAPSREDVLALPGFLDMGAWTPTEEDEVSIDHSDFTGKVEVPEGVDFSSTSGLGPPEDGGLDVEDLGTPEPEPDAPEKADRVLDEVVKVGNRIVAEETVVPRSWTAPETIVPGDDPDA